ncbi:MAG: hypothetical protein GBAus27B_000045 [Mycoplasmataceae bacterium]|nr:MAG: hypothetical protein GBAus27B_000045 [Mycoplasmataceae bacterium]
MQSITKKTISLEKLKGDFSILEIEKLLDEVEKELPLESDEWFANLSKKEEELIEKD